jgi:ubiquitin C-terminal hydrolase
MRVKVRSERTPVEGGPVSHKTESQTTLALSVGDNVTSIAEALKEYSAAEEIDYEGEQHYRQLLLRSLPQVLTITLKRFALDKKITSPVTATDPLQIPGTCLSQAVKNKLQGQPATYRLQHVVHHRGPTHEGGHYTSYGKLPGTDEWYQHDDARPRGRRSRPTQGALRTALDTGYIYVYVKV